MSITASRASNVLRESRNMLLASLTAESGGTETAGAPRCAVQRVGFAPLDPGVRGHHELRDLHPARDGESFRTMVDQDGRHLAAIIGIDGSGRVQHRHPMAERQSRSWPHLSFEPFGKRQRDARRHRRIAAGLERDLRLHGREEIQARGACCGISRQRQVLGVRHALNGDFHAAARPNDAAMRSTSRRATSVLVSSGQASAPLAVKRCTRLWSLPMTLTPCALVATSLARIQSHPLASRFMPALAMTSFVSAAKPMTSLGRSEAWRERPARMSGFSTNANVGAVLRFFSLEGEADSVRQSATAAAHIAISAGSSASQAAHISRAFSTLTSFTRAGGLSVTGPETSTVSAPASASAEAMA